MKKTRTVILTLMCLLLFTQVMVSAEDSMKKEDSITVSNEIKEKIGAFEFVEDKNGEKKLQKAEAVKSVIRIYNTSLHSAFAKNANITEFLNSTDVIQIMYVVEYTDGTFRAFNNDSNYTEILSNGFTKEENGVESANPPVSISAKAIEALQTNSVINKISSDIKVNNVYYLYGEPSMSGTAVYYETNKGDYVYYFHYDIGECLFPLTEFCSFQKAIIEESIRNPVDGGLKVFGIWDLTKYDINSAKFDVGAINALANDALGMTVNTTDQVKTNKMLIWGGFALAVCVLTLCGVFCIVSVRHKKRTRSE